MLVVAIIGLLASIAIPNFLAFQCRAKQSEARSQLGSLFTIEKVFLSEHNSYGTDLVSLGWLPDGAPLYMYGFRSGVQYPATVADIATYDPARNSTLLPNVVGAPPKYDVTRTVDLNGGPFDPAVDLPAVTLCGGQTFVAGAVGDIKPDVTRGLDQWIIDHQRFMTAVSNDCFNLL